MILSFIASVLAITLFNERQQHERQLPWDSIQIENNLSQFPTFNFLFLNQRGFGNITSYIAGKDGLIYNWHFKIPTSTVHYIFFEKGKLYFIHGDGKKEITYFDPIDISSHKTVPRSQFSFRIHHSITTSLRIGNFFWIFGKEDNPFVTSAIQHFKSSIWSIKKHRWLNVPEITNGFGIYWHFAIGCVHLMETIPSNGEPVEPCKL